MVRSFVQVLAQTHPERFPSFESFGRSLPLQERRGRSRPLASAQQLTLSSFTQLLKWLDSDSERAAEKYESIRNGLIKIFVSRGFENAEELADHTFDRVASSVTQLIETYVGDPARYFWGVARAVMMESSRRKAQVLMPVVMVGSGDVSDRAYNCLEKCLNQLSETDRDLILQYYASEKRSKVARREELARSLGVSSNLLQVKVRKIRRKLEACIRAGLKDEND